MCNRQGIGWRENKWWSKQNECAKCEVTEKIRKTEEESTMAKALSQP